ncbi:hypothetical protein K491DRAFT_710030 [Lophiostoma macrostomum CBS 122681]|uniref:ACB domain-containing protein n=1 Tax=Lophiostoma macrostomum CBS 122681 TaxID=1314788 RepID=A0A6A6TSA9_9PLEO|nr:hypothetical protein K491DRAFT_710030 [Lophiostoma macrostomum CBS 122681]
MVSAKFTEVYNTIGSFKDHADRKGDPTDKEKLDLYAWGKVAKSEDISAAKKPAFYDFEGKAKRTRWQEAVDEGISANDAEKKYIELGQALINKHLK